MAAVGADRRRRERDADGLLGPGAGGGEPAPHGGGRRRGESAAPVRFLVAGQRREGVRVTLDAAAAGLLRGGGTVEATMTVASDGAGTASSELTSRR
jgi:hypothetical protein